MAITISGMFSGLDTESIISKLEAANRIPITTLQTRQSTLSTQDYAFKSIASSFTNLRSKLDTLSDSSLFLSKTATLSDTTVGTASVATDASLGAVKVQVTQLATASTLTGGKASALRAASATVSDVFGSTGAGTLSINGRTVTLTASMTMTDVASTLSTAIAATTGGSASYNATTGKFELSSSSTALALGSGTSDFLQQAQLFNNNSTSVTSQTAVGRLASTSALSSSISGLAASGAMSINGVSIDWSSSDTLDTVLQRINNSQAGVVAVYDNYQDRVILSSKTRGAQAITVSDSSGTLAQKLALRTTTSGEGTLSLGKNTQFKVNDGEVRTSVDSTLDASELGVAGLTFNASAVGTTTVNVKSDTSTVKAAIDDFVSQYNSLQSIIASYTAVDPESAENSGVLANDSSMAYVPQELRTVVGSLLGSGSGSLKMLEDLGIEGNADDNTLSVSDSDLLGDALANNLSGVISLFTDSSNGLVTRLGSVLTAYNENANNVIGERRQSIASEKTRIDREIELIEAQVAAETVYMRSAFAAMESASSQASQFSSLFNSTTSSS